jgi:hypothetical protein
VVEPAPTVVADFAPEEEDGAKGDGTGGRTGRLGGGAGGVDAGACVQVMVGSRVRRAWWDAELGSSSK